MSSLFFMVMYDKLRQLCPGGDSHIKRGRDARRLASECKFRILLSLRVLWTKRNRV